MCSSLEISLFSIVTPTSLSAAGKYFRSFGSTWNLFTRLLQISVEPLCKDFKGCIYISKRMVLKEFYKVSVFYKLSIYADWREICISNTLKTFILIPKKKMKISISINKYINSLLSSSNLKWFTEELLPTNIYSSMRWCQHECAKIFIGIYLLKYIHM